MSRTITKETLFPAARPKPATRAEITANASREIIEAEEKHRAAKTERLRQARLEREAEQPQTAPEKPRAKKASAKKTTAKKAPAKTSRAT